MAFAYFVLPTPPLGVGAGLGNRATHLWFRTRFQSCGLGLGGSWRLPYYFLLVFAIHFSLSHASSSAPPPVAGDMAMAFVGDFFLPLKARSPFYFFYVLCRLRCLAIQRRGNGF